MKSKSKSKFGNGKIGAKLAAFEAINSNSISAQSPNVGMDIINGSDNEKENENATKKSWSLRNSNNNNNGSNGKSQRKGRPPPPKSKGKSASGKFTKSKAPPRVWPPAKK